MPAITLRYIYGMKHKFGFEYLNNTNLSVIVETDMFYLLKIVSLKCSHKENIPLVSFWAIRG